MFLLLKIKIINIIIESFISLINKYLLIKNSCINRRKSSIKYVKYFINFYLKINTHIIMKIIQNLKRININKSDIMFYKINMHK